MKCCVRCCATTSVWSSEQRTNSALNRLLVQRGRLVQKRHLNQNSSFEGGFGARPPPTGLAPKIHSEPKIEVLNQKWPKPCSRKKILVTFLGMVWLRATVLGRMGGLSPSKSGCSILPIARPLRGGLSLKPRPQHLLAGAIQLPITPARASFYGRG
jgi:hypothetical protein